EIFEITVRNSKGCTKCIFFGIFLFLQLVNRREMTAGIVVYTCPNFSVGGNVFDLKPGVLIWLFEQFKLLIGTDLKLLGYCAVDNMPIYKADVVFHVLAVGKWRRVIIVRPIAINNLTERNKVADFGNACKNIVSVI